MKAESQTDRETGTFYINYSRGGRHFMVGPYSTRRFAYAHMDDIRRVPGVSNVFLGVKDQKDPNKSYRQLLPITSIMDSATP